MGIENELNDIVRREAVGGELNPAARERIKQMAIEEGAKPELIDVAIDEILKHIKKENDDFGKILESIESISIYYDSDLHRDESGEINTRAKNKEISSKISSAPVPSDKDRLIRLMSSVMPLANRMGPKVFAMEMGWNRGKEDYSHYWWLLFEKLYNRAKVVCPDSPTMPQFTDFYNNEMSKKNLFQKILGWFKK